MSESEEPSFEGYIKFMRDELKKYNIPEEVFGVYHLQKCNAIIGTETFKEAQRIIDKYPQHFPWEHKYKSIPQEVHDAYNKEIGNDFASLFKIIQAPLFDGSTRGKGIFQSMVDSGVQKAEPFTNESFIKAFQDMNDMFTEKERKEQEEEKRKEKIWNKHYGKYKLKYRK